MEKKKEAGLQLLSKGIARHPGADSYTVDPGQCETWLLDILTTYNFEATEFLYQKGVSTLDLNESQKLMDLYLERMNQGEIDSFTLALRIAYESQKAIRALDRANSRPGIERGAAEAGYHVYQVAYHVSLCDFLKEERHILSGRKTLPRLKSAREESTVKRKAKAEKKHKAWQQHATKIWQKNRNLSKVAVAKIIHEKHCPDDGPDIIRQKIKKPEIG